MYSVAARASLTPAGNAHTVRRTADRDTIHHEARTHILGSSSFAQQAGVCLRRLVTKRRHPLDPTWVCWAALMSRTTSLPNVPDCARTPTHLIPTLCRQILLTLHPPRHGIPSLLEPMMAPPPDFSARLSQDSFSAAPTQAGPTLPRARPQFSRLIVRHSPHVRQTASYGSAQAGLRPCYHLPTRPTLMPTFAITSHTLTGLNHVTFVVTPLASQHRTDSNVSSTIPPGAFLFQDKSATPSKTSSEYEELADSCGLTSQQKVETTVRHIPVTLRDL
jgi:hypothetical protein